MRSSEGGAEKQSIAACPRGRKTSRGMAIEGGTLETAAMDTKEIEAIREIAVMEA